MWKRQCRFAPYMPYVKLMKCVLDGKVARFYCTVLAKPGTLPHFTVVCKRGTKYAFWFEFTMCVLQYLNQIASILLHCQHLTNHLTDKYPAIYRRTVFHGTSRMCSYLNYVCSCFFFCWWWCISLAPNIHSDTPFTSWPNFSLLQFMMCDDGNETTNIWRFQKFASNEKEQNNRKSICGREKNHWKKNYNNHCISFCSHKRDFHLLVLYLTSSVICWIWCKKLQDIFFIHFVCYFVTASQPPTRKWH